MITIAIVTRISVTGTMIMTIIQEALSAEIGAVSCAELLFVVLCHY